MPAHARARRLASLHATRTRGTIVCNARIDPRSLQIRSCCHVHGIDPGRPLSVDVANLLRSMRAASPAPPSKVAGFLREGRHGA